MIKNPSHSGQLSLQKMQPGLKQCKFPILGKIHQDPPVYIADTLWLERIWRCCKAKTFSTTTLLQPCDVCILWIFDLLHAIASSESFLAVESWTFQGKCIIGQSFAGKLLLHSNAPTRSLKSLHLKMFWGRLFCAGRLVFLGRKEAKKIDIARRIEGAKPLMFIVHNCSWRL